MTKKIPPAPKEIIPNYPKMADKRLEQLRFTMEDFKVDAVVVTYLPNIRYLTNFSGSAATLFILPNDLIFVTDDRYEEQIKTELYQLPNMKTYISRDVWKLVNDKKLLKHVPSLGFEADRLPYSVAVDIRNKIRPIKFKPAASGIEPFTIPKAPEELACIQQACNIALDTFDFVLGFISPGFTEKEIANEIAYKTRQLGSENDPFDILVVSGPRCGLVHGAPSDRLIKKNDIVIMDFGARYKGFVSDITRTVCVGKPTKEQKELYKLLLSAQTAAVNTVRPGINGKTLDKSARSIIEKAGFGPYFQHSLGHGLGIEVHEMPTITFRMDDQIVPEDAVIAIEPGCYFPDKYGIRVEDNIHVTRNGGKYLTKSPDELISV